jgi:hypothetical protein
MVTLLPADGGVKYMQLGGKKERKKKRGGSLMLMAF